MGTLRTVLANFVPNFVIAFAVASYLRDRKTGVKAGIALGTLAVLGALLLRGKAEELEELVESEIELETDAAEA